MPNHARQTSATTNWINLSRIRVFGYRRFKAELTMSVADEFGNAAIGDSNSVEQFVAGQSILYPTTLDTKRTCLAKVVTKRGLRNILQECGRCVKQLGRYFNNRTFVEIRGDDFGPDKAMRFKIALFLDAVARIDHPPHKWICAQPIAPFLIPRIKIGNQKDKSYRSKSLNCGLYGYTKSFWVEVSFFGCVPLPVHIFEATINGV
jgi:hypothetical protein